MGGAHPSFGGCHRPWPYTRSRVARDFRPSRACYRLGLDGYLRLLEALTREIRQVTQTIESQVQANPQAHLLRTMPGIGAYSALLILSEIGDVHRGSRTVGTCVPMPPWCPPGLRQAGRPGWAG